MTNALFQSRSDGRRCNIFVVAIVLGALLWGFTTIRADSVGLNDKIETAFAAVQSGT